jgi:hypothetical protein
MTKLAIFKELLSESLYDLEIGMPDLEQAFLVVLREINTEIDPLNLFKSLLSKSQYDWKFAIPDIEQAFVTAISLEDI